MKYSYYEVYYEIFFLSSLYLRNFSGPNSIPKKILKLLKNDIFQQWSDMFK